MILLPVLLALFLSVLSVLMLIGAWTAGSWFLFTITLAISSVVLGIPFLIVLSLLFHLVWGSSDAEMRG